ncbi:MAG TPA: hydantoinase/oxoprolinase family protein [Acidobacteriaceae bacterium]|nr:hydantoinase/oxoprolinase family protein [Acidobacteriaceae bacterium]
MRIAIDTGGTFTDCVYLDAGKLRVLKLRSTPSNPATAVVNALRAIGQPHGLEVRHGTTVGTNAMLERKGARVAFVTTAGFQDTIAIGRQARPRLYDLFSPGPACLVPENLRFGIKERVTAEADLLHEPTEPELTELAQRIAAGNAESIAISTLFSFLRPRNELLIEAALRKLGLPISTSHRILPEFREYERASTIVVNAYLMPIMQTYLLSLEQQIASEFRGSKVHVMQSSGGIIPANTAAAEPVRTILSGPAGGVIAASRIAAAAGFPRLIGLDMGGTSTDVFLIDTTQGQLQLRSESQISGLPVSVPMLDVHTVGAGGGSLARFDSGGLLHVGPESAGSDPGPICFGNGENPTVTDANLLLGRLDDQRFVGGTVALNSDRARNAFSQQKGPLSTVEEFGAGILRVVESNMERAIRFVSVERGLDPRDFALLAFGGGGPLHACALARSLRISTVIIPAIPGALSALGILLADTTRELSRTVMLSGEMLHDLDPYFEALQADIPAEFASEESLITERSVDLRYKGQGYELNVTHNPDAAEAFHALHQRQFGFADRNRQIEIVNVRLRIRIPAEPFTLPATQPQPGDGSQALRGTKQIYFNGEWFPSPIYDRDWLQPGHSIQGPALIGEYTSTTVLAPDCSLEVDPIGNLIVTVREGQP